MARRRLKNWGFTVLGIGSILGVAMIAIGNQGETAEKPAPRALPVSTVEAELVSSFRTLREYTGKIVAARESQVAFERSGKVLEVFVDQGWQVQAGQELARLDTRHLLVEQRRLEASLREATAGVEELVAGPRIEQIEAAQAEVRNLSAQQQLQLAADHLDSRHPLS